MNNKCKFMNTFKEWIIKIIVLISFIIVIQILKLQINPNVFGVHAAEEDNFTTEISKTTLNLDYNEYIINLEKKLVADNNENEYTLFSLSKVSKDQSKALASSVVISSDDNEESVIKKRIDAETKDEKTRQSTKESMKSTTSSGDSMFSTSEQSVDFDGNVTLNSKNVNTKSDGNVTEKSSNFNYNSDKKEKNQTTTVISEDGTKTIEEVTYGESSYSSSVYFEDTDGSKTLISSKTYTHQVNGDGTIIDSISSLNNKTGEKEETIKTTNTDGSITTQVIRRDSSNAIIESTTSKVDKDGNPIIFNENGEEVEVSNMSSSADEESGSITTSFEMSDGTTLEKVENIDGTYETTSSKQDNDGNTIEKTEKSNIYDNGTGISTVETTEKDSSGNLTKNTVIVTTNSSDGAHRTETTTTRYANNAPISVTTLTETTTSNGEKIIESTTNENYSDNTGTITKTINDVTNADGSKTHSMSTTLEKNDNTKEVSNESSVTDVNGTINSNYSFTTTKSDGSILSSVEKHSTQKPNQSNPEYLQKEVTESNDIYYTYVNTSGNAEIYAKIKNDENNYSEIHILSGVNVDPNYENYLIVNNTLMYPSQVMHYLCEQNMYDDYWDRLKDNNDPEEVAEIQNLISTINHNIQTVRLDGTNQDGYTQFTAFNNNNGTKTKHIYTKYNSSYENTTGMNNVTIVNGNQKSIQILNDKNYNATLQTTDGIPDYFLYIPNKIGENQKMFSKDIPQQGNNSATVNFAVEASVGIAGNSIRAINTSNIGGNKASSETTPINLNNPSLLSLLNSTSNEIKINDPALEWNIVPETYHKIANNNDSCKIRGTEADTLNASGMLGSFINELLEKPLVLFIDSADDSSLNTKIIDIPDGNDEVTYTIDYTPWKSGATFDGWYLDKNLTTPASNAITVKKNEDVCLYAKWK